MHDLHEPSFGGRMTTPYLIVVGLAGFMFVSELALAHHGRGNRYDMESEIELQGTVQELVWRNPHTAIIIDVPDESGELVTWVIEHSNVSTLARQGYSRRALIPGEKVTAFVNPGSGGEPIGLCQRVIKEDGTVIFVRDQGPPSERSEF